MASNAYLECELNRGNRDNNIDYTYVPITLDNESKECSIIRSETESISTPRNILNCFNCLKPNTKDSDVAELNLDIPEDLTLPSERFSGLMGIVVEEQQLQKFPFESFSKLKRKGRGQFGAVFRAESESLGVVALKMLNVSPEDREYKSVIREVSANTIP